MVGRCFSLKTRSSATAGGGLAIEGQTSGNTLTPPRPVTVISHPLAASSSLNLPTSRRHLSHSWGFPSHVLLLSHLSRCELAILVTCLLFANAGGCRSGALAARLKISTSASTGLDTAARLTCQLPPCSRHRAICRSSHRDRPQDVVLACRGRG